MIISLVSKSLRPSEIHLDKSLGNPSAVQIESNCILLAQNNSGQNNSQNSNGQNSNGQNKSSNKSAQNARNGYEY